jgi:chaperonin GroES
MDELTAQDGYEADVEDGEEQVAPEVPTAQKLAEILQAANVAELLTEDERTKIASRALDGYRLDDGSRDAWKKRTEAAMDLAMLLTEEKDYPFKGAANIKYPLLTTAALQFNARAYPAIVQTDRVAKVKVNGKDQDGAKQKRGDRVSEHLSWQLTTELPEWEEDTDRLLLIVAIPGCVFRKTYFDPALGRKASRLVTADRLVMNYKTRSLQDCPRISEEMWLYPYEIEERIRDGRFLEFTYGDAPPDDDEEGETDEDGPHKFIEQHRLLDLDGDGYDEPYIVTVHIETEKVCRIVPNFTMKTVRVTPDGKVASIRKQEFYTKYLFMPSPDGGAYGMGLGQLLLSTNEAINTTMNEMLDSGHLANIQGGFISALAGLKDRKITLQKGEFKVLQTSLPANQAVLPVKFDGPSDVLFKLLGLLIEQGKEVSSVKDVLTGDTGGKVMQPTTTLALIEQGMKVFNAIFKRIHRAVKHELDLHARLNFEHLTPEKYNEFWDDQEEQFDPKADYNMDDMNVSPVSDPTLSTQMQKLAQAQVTREIGQGKPWINQMELDRRAFEAAGTPDIDDLFVPPPEPDAFQEAMKQMSLIELKTKIDNMVTGSLKNIADAEAAEEGQQMSAYDFVLRSLQAQHGMEQDVAQQQAPGGPGGLPGMEGQPDDAMGAAAPPGAGAGDLPSPAGPPMGASGGGQPPMAAEPAQPSAPAGAG